MFLWAVCFPLIRVGLEAAPPMWFAGLRALLAGVVLLAAARLAGRPTLRGLGIWSAVALAGITATSLGFFGMFYGGGLVSPGLATVVANTQPLLAAPIAAVALGEHLRPLHWSGLLTGFVGIVLIGAPGMTVPAQTLGVVYILLGAIGVAVGNVVLKRLAGRADVFWAMGWQLTIGAVPLIALGLALEDATTIVWDAPFIASWLVLSILGTSVAFMLWFALLERATLSQLNVFTFLTPIFGLVVGALFFDERLGWMAVLGSVLGVISVFIVARRSKCTRDGLEIAPLVVRSHRRE
jgi:drug/metabolite transporter (DMT)-like permease